MARVLTDVTYNDALRDVPVSWHHCLSLAEPAQFCGSSAMRCVKQSVCPVTAISDHSYLQGQSTGETSLKIKEADPFRCNRDSHHVLNHRS